jgi:hypothetical protein
VYQYRYYYSCTLVKYCKVTCSTVALL